MLSKRISFRILALPLLACTLGASVRAAELGEVKVNSHIGQQLSADIELVDLTPADLADLQARLANPDVFKGANLALPPVLGGMYISVARRENKRYLHLTTLQPVNAEALHIFLELNSGGRSAIRAASLWMSPEPLGQRAARGGATPAAAPLALAQAPAPAAATALAPANSAPPAGSEAGLSEAAQRASAHRKEVAMAQVQAAAQQPSASVAGETGPAAPAARVPEASRAAVSIAGTKAAAGVPPPPSPGPAVKPGAQPAVPQSCASAKAVEAQLQQCQALAGKLADIEGKVQHLQKALGAPSQAVNANAAAPSAVTGDAPKPDAASLETGPGAAKAGAAPSKPGAKPGAVPAKPGNAPVKPGVAADLAGNTRSKLIMLVAGALGGLAALGGLFYFLRKRQAKGPLKIWQSFRKKDHSEPEEPELEEVVEVAAQ